MLNTNITPKSILKKNGPINNKTRKKIKIDTGKNTFHSIDQSFPKNSFNTSTSTHRSIPNTLTIYIQTQVPGAQIIKYTPSMTFPNIQSKVVYFDPLVKLSQSTINEIPKEYQVIEFFDINFFKSLILKTNEPVKTIQQATEEGIIDNNIGITLNNIFKKNSVFYINKNPYIITGYEWERGNWRIDTKISTMDVPTDYYGINSIRYKKLLTEQLNSAKAELNSLPKNVIVGPNFTQLVPNNNKNILSLPAEVRNHSIQYSPARNPAIQSSTNPAIQYSPARNPAIQSSTNPAIQSSTNPAIQSSSAVNPAIRSLPPIPIDNPLPKIKIQVPEETNFNTKNVKINDAKKYSADIHKFFNKDKYKDLNVEVYKNMNSNEKESVLSNIRIYSNSNSSDVSEMYPKTVSASHVKPNTGNGDCLYISIAEAINDHNENAPNKDKITYLSVEGVMYGISQPFTQVVVRTAVANYILNDPELLNQYLELARGFASEMNEDVERKYQQVNQTDLSVTEQIYNSIIDHVYQIHDNFFIVKNSSGNPPFKVTETTQEQMEYILKNSWADERIVTLMPKILKLTVIPIKKTNHRLTIPIVGTTARFYMFVYHNENHYEQIYFSNSTLNRTTIFDATNNSLLPPSYILLLIYGSYYYKLYPPQQDNVSFLKDILSSINQSVNKILQYNNKKSLKFATNFAKMFPSEKAETSLRNVRVLTNGITGGALSNHYTSQIEKNPNISYYITITLNVYPGDTPSFTESSKNACSNNYSNLQKAWAELLGKKYNIQPNYNLLPHNYSKKILKQINSNNKTRKQ